MADKKIGIEFSASGGAQVAAESKKAEAAISKTDEALLLVRGALNAVENESPEFRAAMSEIEESIEQVEDSSRRAKASLETMSKTSPKVAKSSRNMGLAVLEASRAFEDMQYGIRGALNNIPGLIAMLGGSAGLAGAISFAAVASSTLIPKLLEGGEAAREAAAEMEKAQEKIASAAEDASQRVQDAEEEKARAVSESVLDAGQRQVDLYDDQIQRVGDLMRLLKELRATELAKVDREAGEELSQINLDEEAGRISSAEARERRAVTESEAAQRRAEIEIQNLERQLQEQTARLDIQRRQAAAREQAAKAAARQRDAAQGRVSEIDQAANDATATGEQIESIEAQINTLEREISNLTTVAGPGARPAQSSLDRAAVAQGEIDALKEDLRQREEELKGLREQVPEEEERKRLEQAAKNARDVSTTANDNLRAAREELQDLERKLELEKKITETRKERIEADLQADRRNQSRDLNRESLRDANRARQEKDREARDGLKDLDGEVKEVAGELGGLADQAEERGLPKQIFSDLQRLSDALADGTDQAEIAAAQESLAATIEKVSSTSEILTAKLSQVEQRLSSIDAKQEVLQSQLQNQRK